MANGNFRFHGNPEKVFRRRGVRLRLVRLLPGLFAEELATKSKRVATPRADRRAVLPDKLPLDTDNDLIIVNDSITPAVGEITHLSGRILDAKGTRSATPGRDLAGRRQRRSTSTPRTATARSATRTSRASAGS